MKVCGKAELIRYTENPEATVSAAARLCYSSSHADEIVKQSEEKDNAAYIKMLRGMQHLSPFEHAAFTFSISGVSRAFLAQITRHRIASFSVRSQRYVSGENYNYVIPPQIEKLGKDYTARYESQMRAMLGWYAEWQRDLGGKSESANEDARFVLPSACETQMIVTMNARELMHFFEMRCCNRAQWEIRNIAWQMLTEVMKVAPNIFMDAGPTCLNKGCSEGTKSCGKVREVKSLKEELVGKVCGV